MVLSFFEQIFLNLVSLSSLIQALYRCGDFVTDRIPVLAQKNLGDYKVFPKFFDICPNPDFLVNCLRSSDEDQISS